MRNLGGAIGIAVVNTWLTDMTRIQVARFGESLGEAGRRAPELLERLADYTRQLTPDAAIATLQAQGEVVELIIRHAMTLAFNDIFRWMAWAFAAALVLVPFCRPPATRQTAPVESH